MQVNFFDDVESTESTKYNKKILAPQYVPNEVCPKIESLINTSVYNKLVSDIVNSNVSEEEKAFLLKAATRHIVVNYDKVADYYAHASKEMQELMEKSALVIIDFDDAIANGYVQLSKTIDDIVEKSNNG